MRRAGRSVTCVFGVWSTIALTSGIASWLGYVAFDGVPPELIAAITAVAAGAMLAMLAMLADTMIPEAFDQAHDAAGLITVVGFFAAFMFSKLGN